MQRAPYFELVEKTFLSSGKTWTFELYRDYEMRFADDNWQIALDHLLNGLNKAIDLEVFCIDFEYNGIQYLLLINYRASRISVYSKNLSLELTMVQSFSLHEIPGSREFTARVNDALKVKVTSTLSVSERVQKSMKLVDLGEGLDDVYLASEKISVELLEKVRNYRVSVFEKISDFALSLTASFLLIRIHLLKFLAVLPSLDHDKKGYEVKKILQETLRRLCHDSHTAREKKLTGDKKPLPYLYERLAALVLLAIHFIPARLLAAMVRAMVGTMARRFIAGENIEKAQNAILMLAQSGRNATLDQLGELVVSETEADHYCDKVLEIIEGLKTYIPKGQKNAAGILSAHVSIKVSALCSDFRPYAFDHTYKLVAPRLVKILKAAQAESVFVNIDAEHYHYRDLVFDIYRKVLLETSELKDFAHTGIVVQAYLRDGFSHLLQVEKLARERGIRMPIRLVKGAYWDAETVEARAHNFNAPQFLNKEESDIHFRQMVYAILERADDLQLALASHNLQDHAFAYSLRKLRFENAPVIEHQCLHMTYEALSFGLAKMQWPVRNYIPIGGLLVGMAYLVRRIMENSSQVGILSLMRSHKNRFTPNMPHLILKERLKNGEYVFDEAIANKSSEFKNIYPLRSYLASHRELIFKELKNLMSMAENYKQKNPAHKLVTLSSKPSLAMGEVEYDTVATVDAKIELLFKGFLNNKWSQEHRPERFVALLKLADLMLEKRAYLSAHIMLEAGKTLEEAVADVDEAIDFVNFYVREQLDIYAKMRQLQPIGVIGVIGPWNFPLAIPCGMAVAALASGNTVLLKPSEHTPLIGKIFVDLCHEAGIPEDVVQLAQGDGEVGSAISHHELINGIVFTGSKNVGTKLYSLLKSMRPSSRYPRPPKNKLCITEMGGKNAVIVTNNCELDETVSGIIYAAFAHAGQKCSAASRVIVDNQVKDVLTARLRRAVQDLKVGPSFDLATKINPLITQKDQERVRNMAKRAKEEALANGGTVVVDESHKNYPGHCVGPAIFEVPLTFAFNKDSVAQTEVFGPIVHVIGYDHLDEAVKIFNATDYALTGGLYSQSQDDIDYLLPKLAAGNIYINRPNTGARVAIEPFGGFYMSGTGPKAGGRDYLWKFSFIPELKIPLSIFSEDVLGPAKATNSAFYDRALKLRSVISKIGSQFQVEGELKSLEKFIVSEMAVLDRYVSFNRFIPGQTNYNFLDLKVGPVALFVANTNFDTKCFAYFCLNILQGNHLSIVAMTHESLAFWKSLSGLLKDLEYDLQLYTPSYLDNDIDLSVLDDNYNFSDKFLQELQNKPVQKSLRKMCYISECMGVLERMQSQVCYTRAVAINTMRHGAPLEMNLQ